MSRLRRVFPLAAAAALTALQGLAEATAADAEFGAQLPLRRQTTAVRIGAADQKATKR